MPHAESSPSIHMRWHDIAFLHWRIRVDALRPLVPSELEIDTFDGSAWVGLIPFQMRGTRFRGMPHVGSVNQFYECNVRTYVRHQGRSGVWFFSLDAERLLPVIGARLLWSLPYFWSEYKVRRSARATNYRLYRHASQAKTHVVWEVGDALPTAQPESLEHFLTERFALFVRRFGRIMVGRVAHEPWKLHEARVLEIEDHLLAAAGITVSGEPLAHCSAGVDVVGWSLERS